MPLAEISKITLPNGVTYQLKDEVAREAAAVKLSAVKVDTLPTASASTMNRIYLVPHTHSGTSTSDRETCDEYITVEEGTTTKTYKWELLGHTDIDLSNYSQKGHTHSVTTNVGITGAAYTPGGTVSKPTFAGTEGDVSVTGTPSGTVTISKGSGAANYTPEGTVSKPNVTVTPEKTTVNSITDVGALPSFIATVADETLSLSFSPGTLPTKGAGVQVLTGASAALAEAPTFTGTGANLKASFTGSETTSTGKFTPAGEVSKPTFTGTAATITPTLTNNQVTTGGPSK